MKNKYIVILASCLFIAVAGLCYSCSYGKNHGQPDSKIYGQSNHGQSNNGKSNHGQEILLSSNDSANDDGKLFDNGQDQGNSHMINEDADAVIDQQPFIYVHLCGAVVKPDVYRIEAGARLVDLIEAAGGLLPEAAGDYMNQATKVEDGQRIYIPTGEELEELTISEYINGDQGSQKDTADNEADGKVDINTADEAKLMSLPGIGQAKAKSIITYRTKNGSFKATKDLMNIPGIKEGLFSKIEDLITVK